MNDFGDKKQSSLSFEPQESAEPGNPLVGDRVPHLIKWGMIDIQLSWNGTPVSRRTGPWTWASRRAKLIAFISAVLALGEGLGLGGHLLRGHEWQRLGGGRIGGAVHHTGEGEEQCGGGRHRSRPGGIYVRTNTFTLTSANSGTTYRNYTNETPILVGGLPIVNFTTWQNNIIVTDVSTQGFGGIHFGQLIFNGERQRLARYPNFVSADPCTSGWSYVAAATGGGTGSFVYTAGDVRTYSKPTEASVFIFSGENWVNNIWGFRLSMPAPARYRLPVLPDTL